MQSKTDYAVLSSHAEPIGFAACLAACHVFKLCFAAWKRWGSQRPGHNDSTWGVYATAQSTDVPNNRLRLRCTGLCCLSYGIAIHLHLAQALQKKAQAAHYAACTGFSKTADMVYM